jgi:hypothetical protein
MESIITMIPKPIVITETLELVLATCRDLTVEGEIGFDEECGYRPLSVLGAVAAGWNGETYQVVLDDEDKRILARMAPITLIADQLEDADWSLEDGRLEFRFCVPGAPLIASGAH